MDLLTESQAAELLGLSARTLKRERRQGAIEYTQLGQRIIRYTQRQLDEYIERGRRRMDAPAPVAMPRRGAAVQQVSSATASLALARSIIDGRRTEGLASETQGPHPHAAAKRQARPAATGKHGGKARSRKRTK